MQSQWLSDGLNALEAQTDIVTLSSPADESPNAAALRLSAISDTGAFEFDFPMSEREATRENGPIEHYQRTVQGVVSEKYKAVHILHAQKAIAASHKTSMRINAMGMLSMQMMMMDARGKQNYIDFRVRWSCTIVRLANKNSAVLLKVITCSDLVLLMLIFLSVVLLHIPPPLSSLLCLHSSLMAENRCWICLVDKTDDDDEEWSTPCSCSLIAHRQVSAYPIRTPSHIPVLARVGAVQA